ncbi:hypothetical protein, partial [Staphylococcus aureus]
MHNNVQNLIPFLGEVVKYKIDKNNTITLKLNDNELNVIAFNEKLNAKIGARKVYGDGDFTISCNAKYLSDALHGINDN